MLTNTRYLLHYPPLRKFHATRVYSSKLQASVRLGSPTAKVKATSSRPSKVKVKKEWKRSEGKRSRNESSPARLSTLLRRHDQKPRYQHTVGGESTFSRRLDLAKSKAKLFSNTKWVAHPRTSEHDTSGGSPYFSKLCLFIRMPRTANFG